MTAPVQLIDPAALTNRRRELGMSRTRLSQLTQISVSHLERLERGDDQAHLNLGALTRLADALAVDLDQLWLPAATHTPTPCHHIDDLAAALADADTPLTAEQLAAYLGATLTDVTDALAELDRRLRHAGLALHHDHHGGISLVAATIAHHDRITTEQHRHLTAGTLPRDLLAVLRTALDQPLHPHPQRRHPNRNRAIRLGLLEPTSDTDGATFTPTADVLYSLGLIQEPQDNATALGTART